MRAAITAACLLAACAQQGKWYHQTASEAQFNQDRRECEYEAAKATAGTVNGVQAGYEKASLGQMCMETRGYYWKAD